MKIEIELSKENIKDLGRLWDFLYATYQTGEKPVGCLVWLNLIAYISNTYYYKELENEN